MNKRWAVWVLRPAPLFLFLSLVIGTIVLAIVPPLRAPDENAHFLRAYGLWRGDILPRQSDDKGRRGIFIPSHLHAEFSFFERARETAAQERVSYRHVYSEFAVARPQPSSAATEVFVPYGGSEGYSPVSYVPYVLVAGLAETAGASWHFMLYLMRFFGLVLTTALITYAIARTPVLPWGFFAVAMLPSSLYGRSVISADGAVLAATLVILALCLRTALGRNDSPASRGFWYAVCALTKPSQVVFVALEGMTRPFASLARSWLSVAALTLPAVVLCVAWVLATGGEMAAWRLHGEGDSGEQFRIGWKLKFMLQHPLHFPWVAFTTLDYSAELWRQLIGVLGWLDTRLHPLAYPVVSGLLVLANLARLAAPADTRRRVSFVSLFTAAAYTLVVFFLFFVTSTPIDADRVHGVQGRYFVVVVPLLAIFLATLLARSPPRLLQAGAAVLLALISGLAIVEAVLRKDWF
jgi:uncharacterized membrane protein